MKGATLIYIVESTHKVRNLSSVFTVNPVFSDFVPHAMQSMHIVSLDRTMKNSNQVTLQIESGVPQVHETLHSLRKLKHAIKAAYKMAMMRLMVVSCMDDSQVSKLMMQSGSLSERILLPSAIMYVCSGRSNSRNAPSQHARYTTNNITVIAYLWEYSLQSRMHLGSFL